MDYMATNRQIPRFTNTGDMRVNSTDNQVRIRGYGNYDISNSHGLSVEAISSPIRANNDLLADTYTTTEKRRLHSMLGRIRLDSRLTERLANTLSMSYVWSESGKSQSAENSESMSWRSSRYDLDYYGRHSLLHNRTTYHFSIGALGVTPQLSASWRILSGSKKYHSEVFNQQGNPSSVTRGMFGLGAQHRILLAPSLHLHYKDIAYLQSGLHVDFSKSDILLSDDSEKYFPFLSGGWDLGKMLLPELQWSVLLTGSYAKTGNFSDETTDRLFSRFPPDGGGAILRPPFNTDRTIGNYWQAGSKISYGQDKFFAQYWYSKADYPANLELPFMTAENIREHVRSHYIGGGTQLHQNGWQWRSNLLIRWQFVSLQNQAAQGEANFQRPATTPRNLLDERWGNPRDGEDRVVVEFPSGVSKVKPNLYTEWNHRLHYNQLFVGLDLFHASQQVFSDVITTPNQSSIRSIDQKTSMGLRTLHLGYQFSAFGASQLEAYGFMRNFSENEMGLSSENAFRTYGAGLMFSL